VSALATGQYFETFMAEIECIFKIWRHEIESKERVAVDLTRKVKYSILVP
jgi:hypothetical protein